MSERYNGILSVWVLIPRSKPQPSDFFCPQALNILTSPPRQTKNPDNSNNLNMFNNNTYTYFKTAYKHMLILQWCHARRLFGSQIPVITGGFELQISCIPPFQNLRLMVVTPSRKEGGADSAISS